MNTCHALLLAALGCVVSAEALSRPVSYAGGWTLIGESDRQSSSALLHYTPTYQWSLGPRVEVNRDDHFSLTTIHATRLAKRWFGSDYQGNLYFFGGAGMASGVDGNGLEDRFAAYGGVMADWETRSLSRAIVLAISMHRTSARNSCTLRGSVLHLMRVIQAHSIPG